MRRIALALILLALAWTPAHAQRSLAFESFRSEIRVHPDAVVEVAETLEPRFHGRWQGIVRDLSLEHRTAEGRREKLDLTVLGATDAEGNRLRHEVESPDGWTRRVRVWVPGAEDATRTVVLHYRLENALRFFEEECEPGPVPVLTSIGEECRPHRLDELYWNVTGNQWEVPLHRVEARIELPAGVTPTQVATYSGRTGDTGTEAAAETRGNVVTVRHDGSLNPGEGLTVGVGWEPGAVQRPTRVAEALAGLRRLAPLGLPFLAFGLCFLAWRRRGRDPRGRPIAVAYEPPEDLTPGEVGTLVDHEVDMREITATLVDLAVKGYLRIEEREEKKLLGLARDTEYVFHLRRPESGWGGLLPHERKVLEGVFKKRRKADLGTVVDAVREAGLAHAQGKEFDKQAFLEGNGADLEGSVELSDLRNSFYSSLPGIHTALYERLMERGYYRARPDKVKGRWLALALALLFPGVFAAVITSNTGFLGLSGPAVLVGILGAAAVVFGFGLVMPARTPEGARTREAALGFREFLEKVESDRYRRMITSPEMFERYLPYAMTFGVEDRWASAFEELCREPPDWYSGRSNTTFSTRSFTSGLGTLSSRAQSTMSSRPSSSSSGSGGGGSSGGGSGGGGGGGF